MHPSEDRFHRRSALLLFLFFLFLAIENPVRGGVYSAQSDRRTLNANISGKVTDAHTGAPLYFANVFLARTTLGAASDSAGAYCIERIPPGRHEIVAAMIGYETRSFEIEIDKPGEYTLDFELTGRPVRGEEVGVSASYPHEWKRCLRLFEEWFLGTSRNASECILRNPEVLRLDLDPDRQKLSAVGEKPLLIDNEALGYRVTVYLQEYVLDARSSIRAKYWLKFDAMEPEDEAQGASWERRRAKAYLGSQRHFFRALVSGTLDREKFQVYETSRIRTGERNERFSGKFRPEGRLSPGTRPGESRLAFPEYLKIVYTGEPEPSEYVRFLQERSGIMTVRFGTRRAQTSWLELTTPSVTIDERGYARDPYALISHGFWAWKRFAEELPLEYVP